MCTPFGSIYRNFSALFYLFYSLFSLFLCTYTTECILAGNLGVSSTVYKGVISTIQLINFLFEVIMFI